MIELEPWRLAMLLMTLSVASFLFGMSMGASRWQSRYRALKKSLEDLRAAYDRKI